MTGVFTVLVTFFKATFIFRYLSIFYLNVHEAAELLETQLSRVLLFMLRFLWLPALFAMYYFLAVVVNTCPLEDLIDAPLFRLSGEYVSPANHGHF
jgi:hypothetical protein